MGDEEVREVELALELLEEVDDLRLDRNVERGDRLVGDDEVRVERERPGDADPLALAARELVWVAFAEVRVEADRREQLADPLAPLGAVPDAVDLERLADDPRHVHPRVEAGVRVLEDHLHPAAHAPQGGPLEAREVDAVEHDPARCRPVQADDRPAGRALPTAGLADEAKRLAAPEREAHVVDRPDVADVALDDDPLGDREPDLQLVDPEQLPVRGRRPTGRRGGGRLDRHR